MSDKTCTQCDGAGTIAFAFSYGLQCSECPACDGTGISPIGKTHEHKWEPHPRGFVCVQCGASEPACAAVLGHATRPGTTLACELVGGHDSAHLAHYNNGSPAQWGAPTKEQV